MRCQAQCLRWACLFRWLALDNWIDGIARSSFDVTTGLLLTRRYHRPCAGVYDPVPGRVAWVPGSRL